MKYYRNYHPIWYLFYPKREHMHDFIVLHLPPYFSPIIFILHKWSSDIFNASWYYKEFSNSVNILWKNYHIIDLKGLRTLTQIFFEQILIKTIGEVNGHPDYVSCFWLLLFKLRWVLFKLRWVLVGSACPTSVSHTAAVNFICDVQC